MTVGELKDILECVDDDTEIRMMTQKTHPLTHYIAGLTHSEDIETDEDIDILYVVQGSDIGYGTKAAWDETM